ncbi:LysR family transcriptional regulator [Ralstonia solanacearum]|uniref:LysR family transcriptional regulator n=1 Tax=Ralstonia solanacearum TaxID=305 RepID=UPI0018D115BA|nr:LysR family transcriptional regulator [Ralstonia solanacearum]
MDRLQSMRVFAKVVELGSFARAAQHLSMSNAVVTRYVADLEAHLGTRLLNRTTRSLSLTDVGETYLQRCQQVLLDIDEAESLATSRSQVLVGSLRIVAPVMFGLHVLPMLLARFQQLYPEVTFDVALSDRPIDIVEDGRDIGIMVSELGLGSHLVARRMISAEMIMAATPAYLRQHTTPQRAEDIADHRVIAMWHPQLRHEWEMSAPDGQSIAVPVQPSLVTSNAELMHRAVLADMGIAILSSYMARPDLESGRLVRVLPQYKLPHRSLSLVYPSRKFLPTKVRTFIDYMLAQAMEVKHSEARAGRALTEVA